MPVWHGSTKASFAPWVATIVAVVVVGLVVAVSNSPEPAPAWVPWLLVAIGVAAVAAAVLLGRVEVVIDGSGIAVRFGPRGWPSRHFPWAQIASVSAVDVRPMSWGGWGYRWVPWRRATAAVMRAGEGLRLDLADGRVFVVTVDGAAHAAVVARGLLV